MIFKSFAKKFNLEFNIEVNTVWRTGLWRKLQNCEIKGKCFKIIYNMYNDIKSCVQYNGSQSDFFSCLTGVRQGENLFPFLFSIFLNDLEDFFRQKFNLEFNIEVNNFPTQLISVIARKLSGSDGFPLFL
jgi:hypothetical protein